MSAIKIIDVFNQQTVSVQNIVNGQEFADELDGKSCEIKQLVSRHRIDYRVSVSNVSNGLFSQTVRETDKQT